MSRFARRLALIVLSTLVFGVGCSGKEREPGQWPMSREDLERNAATEDPAEATYRRYCISCHGVDGRGNGGATGADLTAVPGPLTLKSDAELVQSVSEGRRGERATMPAHKPVLTPAQIAAVVGYVRARFSPK